MKKLIISYIALMIVAILVAIPEYINSRHMNKVISIDCGNGVICFISRRNLIDQIKSNDYIDLSGY